MVFNVPSRQRRRTFAELAAIPQATAIDLINGVDLVRLPVSSKMPCLVPLKDLVGNQLSTCAKWLLQSRVKQEIRDRSLSALRKKLFHCASHFDSSSTSSVFDTYFQSNHSQLEVQQAEKYCVPGVEASSMCCYTVEDKDPSVLWSQNVCGVVV